MVWAWGAHSYLPTLLGVAVGDGGWLSRIEVHCGVIRLELLGYDQDYDALMIFDWVYQVQAGNPDLVESVGG